jgi:hypothetical protein
MTLVGIGIDPHPWVIDERFDAGFPKHMTYSNRAWQLGHDPKLKPCPLPFAINSGWEDQQHHFCSIDRRVAFRRIET